VESGFGLGMTSEHHDIVAVIDGAAVKDHRFVEVPGGSEKPVKFTMSSYEVITQRPRQGEYLLPHGADTGALAFHAPMKLRGFQPKGSVDLLGGSCELMN